MEKLAISFIDNLSNLVLGINITKNRENGSIFHYEIKKGKTVVGEAYTRLTNSKVEIQIIRRLNQQGKGLMTTLLKNILEEAKFDGRKCFLDLKPFQDKFRPNEEYSKAVKRLRRWYGSFGFQYHFEDGLYYN